jgi:RNA polymerase sigma-70 factor (ECF subfamily)
MDMDEEGLDATTPQDEAAFEALVRSQSDRIRLHCYRMLGSFHDAEDALQETLIKAWRHRETFRGGSSFGTWLFRIATTTCLNMLRGRPRIVVPVDLSDRHRPAAADVPWLEPYPDALIPSLEAQDPADRFEAKEATRLAFVATLQLLPARQRAVLLLRDVLSWNVADISIALDTTDAAVSSALQRARARLAEHLSWDEATPEVESVVDEWIRYWEAGDLRRLTSLLAHDALMAMPPTPAWFSGPDEIGRFFATVPSDGRIDLIRLIRTRANGQPAVGAYMPTAGRHVGYGLMVFDLSEDRIAAITGFQDARLIRAFALPESV